MTALAFAVMSFSSLFAVIDPFGCIPFYSGLTAKLDRAEKLLVLRRALSVAFVVLVLFVWFGDDLMHVFGITVEAFRIAGGVIFFGIGLDMLQSQPRRWRTGIRQGEEGTMEAPSTEHDDPSITPLAIPLLAGPGSIMTVVVLAPDGPDGWLSPLLLTGAVAAILLLTGGILASADVVLRRLGPAGLRLIEKLMGLMVTVIAVQFIIDGTMPLIRRLLTD